MTDLTIIQKNGKGYVDSREVAEFIGKNHKELLRDIRGYAKIMEERGERKIALSYFFIESSYLSAQNKVMPCYLLSKAGCEFVSNKLTGEKGVLFTALFVQRFNEMEEFIKSSKTAELPMNEPSTKYPAHLGEFNAAARLIVRSLRYASATPAQILAFLKSYYEKLGITLFDNGEEVDFDDEEFEIDDLIDDNILVPKLFTATEIADMLGILSYNGKPHGQAVSHILNKHIHIGDAHKMTAEESNESYFFCATLYDDFAIDKLGDWLFDNGYPTEVAADGFAYHIVYNYEN